MDRSRKKCAGLEHIELVVNSPVKHFQFVQHVHFESLTLEYDCRLGSVDFSQQISCSDE